MSLIDGDYCYEWDHSNEIRTILQEGAFVLKRSSTVLIIEIHYYESNMV